MSASERLSAMDAAIQETRRWGAVFPKGNPWETLETALPEIVAVVEAAEVARKIEATSSYKSIYSAPGEMAAPLRAALAALEEKLSA